MPSHMFRSTASLPRLFLLFLVLVQSSRAGDRTSEIQFKDNGVEIQMLQPLAKSSLKIARLNNPITGVFLKTQSETRELKLKPLPDLWEILPPDEGIQKGDSVFVETIGKPQLAGNRVVVEPDDSGVLHLNAHLATTYGQMLRYEPQPHKNTLGYWIVESDYPEWSFRVNKPGKYRIEILQGCGEGQGGSWAEVGVGDTSLKFKVKETGHFQNFERHRIGTVEIDSTEVQTLKVNILQIANKAAMDIRLIELIPED